MKVWTKIEYRWDAARQEYVVDEALSEWHEYDGPVAECKKDSKASKPDAQIGKAAMLQAQTGEKWLTFAEKQFDIANARQEDVDALTKRVTEQQLATQDKNNQRADEQWERQVGIFQPLEDRMVQEANDYDSPERQARMAAEARADVMRGAASAQRTQQRQMAAMGVNPTSGRFQGVDRATQLATALAGTGASNKARNDVRNMGIMLRKDASNFGRGLTGTAAQSYGLGLNAGNSASGNQMAAEGNLRANQQIMGQGFQGAMSGYQGQASTLNNLYNSQLQAYQANQQSGAAGLGGIATIASAGIMAY